MIEVLIFINIWMKIEKIVWFYCILLRFYGGGDDFIKIKDFVMIKEILIDK